jgi:hypothetical protein
MLLQEVNYAVSKEKITRIKNGNSDFRNLGIMKLFVFFPFQFVMNQIVYITRYFAYFLVTIQRIEDSLHSGWLLDQDSTKAQKSDPFNYPISIQVLWCNY